MGGYEACRKIREWEVEHGYAHVPIISLSANVMRHGWRESAANGFTQYCMKPVKFADLGYIIIDLIKPGTPHVFLRDRPVPQEVLDQEAAA
jgi:CheY-like chemotaxis protein